MIKKLLFLAVVMAVTAASTKAQVVVLAEAPASVEGSYNFSYSFPNGWGGDLTGVVIQAQAVLYDDGTVADSLACEPAVNAAELAGKIAFLYRGECEFGAKALNAQDAGAVAVVMVNNIPGDPVGMGGGAVGSSVTIPVVMITQDAGAVLRPFADSGELMMFIGNKTGYFAHDSGFQNRDIAMAKSSSIPVAFAQSASDFNVPVGAWVNNYGFEIQNSVALNATVTMGGNELYNETSTAMSIPAEDSAFVALPIFSLFSYPVGLYTITYTASSENEDDFANDNVRTSTFWVNDQGLYSKSRINSDTGYPIASGGLRPSDSANYTWCTFFRSENAAAEQVYGVSFSCVMSAGLVLTGQFVYVELFQWNDPFDENTTEITFNDLELIADVEYNYDFDYQNEFVSAIFPETVALENNEKYLMCASIFVDDMFFRVDGGLDYNRTYDAYPLDVFFPLISGGEWFAAGFGSDNAPAIITHFAEPNIPIIDIEEMPTSSNLERAYPNPAQDLINIPMPDCQGDVLSLNVMEMNGKVVSQLMYNGQSGYLPVDIAGMDNGVYLFQIMDQDALLSTFKVVVNR